LCHTLLEDARFFGLQERIDSDLTALTQEQGCPACGGRLDRADYPRKPRGGPDGHERRQSLCCSVEGCRKRATPPSVRFLGRKVYLGAMVVLATVLQQGTTPRRVSYLRELLGVSRRTLRRWRSWWSEVFGRSPFWRVAQGRLARPVQREQLPLALLELMGWRQEHEGALLRLLRFLAPISTRPHLDSHAG